MLRISNRKAGWHRAAVLALVFAAIVGIIGSSAALAADVDGMQELGANPSALSFGNVAVGATSLVVTKCAGDRVALQAPSSDISAEIFSSKELYTL